ncbi:MAG: hypothetical protein KatS3mg055_0924 [Chloroflexus sp.]|nr:MAG: hypothetical protein KatS3mg055_0924 [Chloroflexus sp.]
MVTQVGARHAVPPHTKTVTQRRKEVNAQHATRRGTAVPCPHEDADAKTAEGAKDAKMVTQVGARRCRALTKMLTQRRKEVNAQHATRRGTAVPCPHEDADAKTAEGAKDAKMVTQVGARRCRALTKMLTQRRKEVNAQHATRRGTAVPCPHEDADAKTAEVAK